VVQPALVFNLQRAAHESSDPLQPAGYVILQHMGRCAFLLVLVRGRHRQIRKPVNNGYNADAFVVFVVAAIDRQRGVSYEPEVSLDGVPPIIDLIGCHV